jgi:hypothetical protein
VRRALTATIVGAAALTVGASAAQAANYAVWSCHDGSGNPAPVAGWTSARSSLGDGGSSTNTCGSATGGLTATFLGTAVVITNYPSGSFARWEFFAPASTTVDNVTLDRSFSVGEWNSMWDHDASPMTAVFKDGPGTGILTDGPFLENCISYFGCRSGDSTVNFPVNSSTFSTAAGCVRIGEVKPTNDCVGDPSGRASITVRRAKIVLADSTAPSLAAATGASSVGTPLKGVVGVDATASDAGSGIAQVQVKIDDQIVRQRAIIDDNNGACTAQGATSGYLALVPCKLNVSATLPVDTTKVSDGNHVLSVQVWDAAGTASNVVSRAITVANAVAGTAKDAGGTTADATAGTVAGDIAAITARIVPPTVSTDPATAPGLHGGAAGVPNGTGGDLAKAHFAAQAKLTKRSAAYGSKVTLKGQLLDKKRKPIAGAHVDVYETLAVVGSARVHVATVDTDAKGRFSYRPATTSPRTVEFAYATSTGSDAYLDQRTVKLGIHAALSLKISPKSPAKHAKVTFTGKVDAGPLPPDGARMVIEARGAHAWYIVADINTNAAGEYSWSHRFTVGNGYTFRARLTKTALLTVAPAASALVRIHVR